MRLALVTGITGQDGAYLAQLLLRRSTRVVGLLRPGSDLWRLERLGILGEVERVASPPSQWHEVVRDLRPEELYHLGARTNVGHSYVDPVGTLEDNAVLTARLLEAVRHHSPRTRFLQASSGAMYTDPKRMPIREDTPLSPGTPYGSSKAAAHWLAANYREAFGLHVSCAILLNHESPLRGPEVVTRRIASGMAALARGGTEPVHVGNPAGRRDWGHARDFVEGMWRMVQRDRPSDYVLATGVQHSIAEFVAEAARTGGFSPEWDGEGLEQTCRDAASGRILAAIDPRFFRPTEAAALVGDPRRAARDLGWTAETPFEALVAEMVESELAAG